MIYFFGIAPHSAEALPTLSGSNFRSDSSTAKKPLGRAFLVFKQDSLRADRRFDDEAFNKAGASVHASHKTKKS